MRRSGDSSTDDSAVEVALDTIPDPIGTFYRYGLAGSMSTTIARHLP